MEVLNIGGGNKRIPLPPRYVEWNQKILDVTNEADYKKDLLDLYTDVILGEPFPKFDAIYMSHALEHFEPSQITYLLKFFKEYLLKPEGFLELKVPDVLAMMKHIVNENLCLIDPLYRLKDGTTINAIDILYGHQLQIAKGNKRMAHKVAFDKPTLETVLGIAEFTNIEWIESNTLFELNCICRF